MPPEQQRPYIHHAQFRPKAQFVIQFYALLQARPQFVPEFGNIMKPK
jgi:hypothetical protein